MAFEPSLFRNNAFAGAVFSASVWFASHAVAATVDSYAIIATGNFSGSDEFTMSDAEVGAIGVNPDTSPPGSSSIPALPADTTGLPKDNPYNGEFRQLYDGDVLLTGENGNVASSSNSQINANVASGVPNGTVSDLTAGRQGIDCRATYNNCTDSGSNITSNNKFNKGPTAPSTTPLGAGQGVQQISGSVVDQVVTELETTENTLFTTTATDSYSFEKIENTDYLFQYLTSGTQYIDFTNSSDFTISQSNVIFEGLADTFLVFRFKQGVTVNITQSNLVLKGGIGLNNIWFITDADASETSFTLTESTSVGVNFWDVRGASNNNTSLSQSRICGQIVNDSVNLQNGSVSRCASDLTPIPLPASSALMVTMIAGFAFAGYQGRRKTS